MQRWLVILGCLVGGPALALDPFEIQVYQGEHNDPGQASLEVHLNTTDDGRAEPAWEGELAPAGMSRLTFEPAIGVTPWFELGMYFQTMLPRDGYGRFGGAKLRTKFILPPIENVPCNFGVNLELDFLPHAVDEAPWASELRPIAACAFGRFEVGVNPIVGTALVGEEAWQPELEPSVKVAWNTNLGFGLGAEYYAGLGRFLTGFARAEQEHVLFATFDLMPPVGQEDAGRWALNLAVGHGLLPSPERGLVVKMIVGYAF